MVRQITINIIIVIIFLRWENVWFSVDSGLNALMSISDGLGPYFSWPKMEKTGPLREEMDGEVFISSQSRRFAFVVNMIRVLSLFVLQLGV